MNPLSASIALALMALSFTASARNLGAIDDQPSVQTLNISAPDVTFSTPYTFSLLADATVSATASTLSLSIGGVPILGSADFSLKLFDDTSGSLLAVASLLNGAYQIDDVRLPANQYHFLMSGRTSGLSGGSYVFAAAALSPAAMPVLPAVPEPSALVLLLIGLGGMGLLRLRQRSAQ
jgi:hypothetical protein